MDQPDGSAGHNLQLFDPAIYRLSNQDLRGFSDEECAQHFHTYGIGEKRPFGRVDKTHDRLSMRWLRGRGIEIGAADNPTQLFGAASCVYGDSDADLLFGGGTANAIIPSLDAPDMFERTEAGIYDFAIASHVLEHVDSFLMGLKNLIMFVKPKGIIYASIPICEFDADREWMKYYDFAHHVDEYSDPLKYAHVHDATVIEHFRKALVRDGAPALTRLHDEEFYAAILQGRIPQNDRFHHHKHSYDFQGWTELFVRSLDFLGQPARIMDSCFGEDRMDGNFVLERC